MSEWNDFLQKLCPDGVEFDTLGNLAEIQIGEFIRQDKQKSDGLYPVYNGGKTYTGFYDDYNQEANKIIISARGNAGYVNRVFVPFWSGNSCYTLQLRTDKIDWNFLFYFLKSYEPQLKKAQQIGCIPAISKAQVQNIKIPVPPLEVQQEIVKMLDQFTGLIELLNKELELRKKQYAYYRDQILTFGENSLLPNLSQSDVRYMTIESVSRVLSPATKIKAYDYLTSGIYPVIDQGRNFIGGYTNEEGAFPKGEYIIFGEHTCIVKYVDFEFCQGADGIKVLQALPDVIPKYLFYAMSNIRMKPSYARHWSKMKNETIPVPSIESQHQIVQILDQFYSLCYDQKKGIPAEIEARQKQYAYYRDILLTFKEKAA